MPKKRLIISLLFCLSFSCQLSAQNTQAPKYNSLLWQITGNGLTKPSYLFGTMHVSNKMAFHLSDSFYYALKNVDAVALELNPKLWQEQMVKLNILNENYTNYIQTAGNDYLDENSFRIKKYDDVLKAALSTEPPVVNSLLYRSFKSKEDFEEDTFLDLYIFQTGRKMGKAAAGVEDYYQSEKLVLEAYADMAKEKKRNNADLGDETMSSLAEKLQDAYKNGNLDLLDSIENLLEHSTAFKEKFLYKRNEIQANSIDSIIKKTSLFAGVGAAHLPGNRGVIELLRQKGYTVRPVKMSNRDALRKEEIDRQKVKVNFSTQQAADGMYSVQVPGYLYSIKSAYQLLNRRQYADMDNGSYYMVTRVKTYAAFTGHSVATALKKVDSLLYENIPGRILSKKMINNNGYPGFDIINRTRRGDMQRYQAFATPYEIIIFKMSGHNEYVAGEEGNRFFSSIHLKAPNHSMVHFTPQQGGFTISLPEPPNSYFNDSYQNRWEYQAQDTTNGDAYLIFKKSNYNFNFLEKDSFVLQMIEESFRSPDYFDKQLSRKQVTLNGYPALLVREQMKNGSIVNAACLLLGSQYFVIARHTNSTNDSSFSFLNSFSLQPYQYQPPQVFTDTFLNVRISTPIVPAIDAGMRTVIEQSMQDAANGNNYSGYIAYWPKIKNGLLMSDSTGEEAAITMQEFPKYYYIKDSIKFWDDNIKKYAAKQNMLLYASSPVYLPDNTSGYRFTLRDTGSSATIERLEWLKGRYLFTLTTMGDTISRRSKFIDDAFQSFRPYCKEPQENIYQNRLPLFFSDLFSSDSALHKKAQQSISNLNFGSSESEALCNAIAMLSINDKDYFDSKARLIAELGFLKDTATNVTTTCLQHIYEQVSDTSLFQNEVIMALARLKTKTSFTILKNLMLQAPPVFDKDEYSSLFENMEDTLKLSASLFPALLQLTTLTDYKAPVTKLLVTLVDSGYLQSKDYEKYFSSIFIDAIVAQKKQQIKDERIMVQTKMKEDDPDIDAYKFNYRDYDNGKIDLNDYAVLLMPFYNKNKQVQNYFTKMLLSKDKSVRMDAAVLMMRNNKPLPDSIVQSIASDNKYLGTFYEKLYQSKCLNKLPAAYNNQLLLAKSYLVDKLNSDLLDSIVFIKKIETIANNEKGMVYFFKYRIKKEDEWKIGMSGLQPLDSNETSVNDDLTFATNKTLIEYEPLDEQLNKQLKRILFSLHKSARYFFSDDVSGDDVNMQDDEN